ncbi:MAG: chloride channel protein [Myxococcales bacterium]
MDEPAPAPGGERAPQPFWHPGRLLAPGTEFPWESTLLNLTAVLVGVYAGLATGLLANFIGLFHLLFFRTHEFLAAPTQPSWRLALGTELRQSPWHFEYLAIAVAALLAARALSPLGETRTFRRVPIFQKQRLRLVASVLGFGLVLYYPVLFLAAFTRSFGEASGGLVAMLLQAPRLLRILVPAVGGLAAGVLVRFVAPDSAGHGVVEVMAAVAEGNRIPGRVALWKSMVAGLVIGSGGSCGREGPVVHMGAAVGNELGERLGLSRENISLLLACGGAAGIAASFNAPIAGAMFALEILLGAYSLKSFSPILLAAVTATTTARTLLGAQSEIVHVKYALRSPGEIGAYALLGLLCAVGGVAYARTLHRAEALFGGHDPSAIGRFLARFPPYARPMLGGLGTGLLGLFVPEVLGNGYETMNAALLEQLGFGLLAAALVAKLFASASTLGSGAPGGTFFPAVFLGAMLGGAFGSVLHGLLPNVTAGAGAYAAVGMGAFVAGATLAPLTGILMVFELTGNYQSVLPLMVACGLAATVVQWVLGGSIYTLKLRAHPVEAK